MSESMLLFIAMLVFGGLGWWWLMAICAILAIWAANEGY